MTQSVSRALQLLALFGPRNTQWTVTDLARESGLHKSVVTRLMATMAASGFVVQDSVSKSYGVGPRAFTVGTAYRPYTLLNRVARPIMQDITSRCGYATSLGVPAGDKYVYLMATESDRAVRVAREMGELLDYHANATGRVLLADLPDDEIRALIGPDPLPKVTPYTVDSYDQLMLEIRSIRERGISFNREEAALGAGGVACPIRNDEGRCVAGLSVVYPIHVVSDEEIGRIADSVRDGAVRISERIGSFSGLVLVPSLATRGS
ncbi:MAG: IclR family transcriptional regulator [Thermomicrobiales bacterium]